MVHASFQHSCIWQIDKQHTFSLKSYQFRTFHIFGKNRSSPFRLHVEKRLGMKNTTQLRNANNVIDLLDRHKRNSKPICPFFEMELWMQLMMQEWLISLSKSLSLLYCIYLSAKNRCQTISLTVVAQPQTFSKSFEWFHENWS